MKSDCVLATLLLIALGATAVSAQTTQRAASAATFVGTAMLSGADADQTYITDFCFEQSGCGHDVYQAAALWDDQPARVPADHVPTPAGNSIVSGSFFGFLALTHRDQRLAPTGVPGGRNFSLEPPDQALAEVSSRFDPVHRVVELGQPSRALKAGRACLR